MSLMQRLIYLYIDQFLLLIVQEMQVFNEIEHLDSISGEHNSKLVHHQATFHQHLEREMMIYSNTNSGILRVENEPCMLKRQTISHRIMSLSSDLLEVRVVYYDLL